MTRPARLALCAAGLAGGAAACARASAAPAVRASAAEARALGTGAGGAEPGARDAGAGAGETPAARRARPLLAPERLAALPEAERLAWARYQAASRAMAARDREAVRQELAALGQARLAEAPHHAGFFVQPHMTGAWFATAAGRAQTVALLSWQTPSGGWSKRLDFGQPRRPGTAYGTEGDGWAYVPTIDNGATTEQLEYLARLSAAGAGGAAERAAYARGVRYLVAAQLPTGCWPQVYPLAGSYHDAATFNDDATVAVLRVLQGAAADSAVGDAASGAAAAARRGVACVVRAQVVEGGAPTAWGQQHDPLTLAPVDARSYEHASLASKESAAVVDFLMEFPAPDAATVAAVHAAADWFRRAAIRDTAYDYRTGMRPESGAGPLWARMYELGSGRPLFSNRDGVRRYRWDELTDRRQGYAWYTDQPAATLRRYARWAGAHPRTR